MGHTLSEVVQMAKNRKRWKETSSLMVVVVVALVVVYFLKLQLIGNMIAWPSAIYGNVCTSKVKMYKNYSKNSARTHFHIKPVYVNVHKCH